MSRSFSFAAVGDISFAGPFADKPREEIFHAVHAQWRGFPLVMGNLECPLVNGGTGVSGKCTMRGNTGWAPVLSKAGFTVLSLANNHIMDYGSQGLFSTMDALDRSGLKYVGAGENLAAAQAPLSLRIDELDVAVLARSSVPVSSACYAGKTTSGAAFLDERETIASIQTCRERSDLVIVLVHWGVEEHRYPTPQQRQLALRMVKAGADMVLGHHPHVLQGVQTVRDSVVAYSLGNFVFGEFEWAYLNRDGDPVRAFEYLKPLTRAGVIFSGAIPGGEFQDVKWLPTQIDTDGSLVVDSSRKAMRRGRYLSGALKLPLYGLIWHGYAMWMEWILRIHPFIFGGRFWRKILKLRWRHVREGVDLIRKSLKVAGGKSTNPYE